MLLGSCATETGGIGRAGGTVGVETFDSKERKIINQARGVGALAGAAAGAAIAHNSGRDAWAGAAIGALAGGLLGDQVGKAQAGQARQKRLENNDLRKLVAAAKENNDRLAAYNRKVRARIAELRKAPPEQRSELAKAELKSVNATIKNNDTYAAQRDQAFSTLPKDQANEVAYVVRQNDAERAQLVSSRNELSKLASN